MRIDQLNQSKYCFIEKDKTDLASFIKLAFDVK